MEQAYIGNLYRSIRGPGAPSSAGYAFDHGTKLWALEP